MFNIKNSVVGNRELNREKWREVTYKLGFEDHYMFYFAAFPFALVLLYEGVSSRLLYGEKSIKLN